MTLLIDGYNLLHASGVFGTGGRTSLESSREALLDWLAVKLGETQCPRTTIVFDARHALPGLPRSRQKHGLQVLFAPRGQEADDLLEQLIRQHHAPRSLTVVSSDHRIHRAARRRRARPIDSPQWVAELRRQSGDLEEPSERPQELDADELRAWLEEFRDE